MIACIVPGAIAVHLAKIHLCKAAHMALSLVTVFLSAANQPIVPGSVCNHNEHSPPTTI